MVYVVGLNGPPHSGKDTIGNALANNHDKLTITAIPFSVAEPIRKAGFAFLGLEYSPEAYDAMKDEQLSVFNPAVPVSQFDPNERLARPTFRNWIINFSERFMKPIYGEDIFGRNSVNFLADLVGDNPALVIIRDCGFSPEQQRVVDWVGPENYQLIHLYREGCDWSKDSRNYIELRGVTPFRLDNNGTIRQAVDTIHSQLVRRGWSL